MPATPNRSVPEWKPDVAVALWAERHGYGPAVEMTDGNLRDLAKRHAGRPVGLYLWEGEQHEIYIGISSTSVVVRLRDHLKNFAHANIQSFRFFEHYGDRRQLRDIERQLIWEAIWAGFTVFNSEHASSIYGASEFDELIAIEDQLAWFEDPAASNLTSAHDVHSIDNNQRARSRKNWTKFTSRPDAHQILDAVSVYLRTCTPFPFQTQIHYWGVSCLPNTRLGPGYKRLSTVNMGVLEMLWINQTPTGSVSVQMGTDYRFLPPDFEREVARCDVAMAGVMHVNGGAAEEVLTFPTISTFIGAMHQFAAIRMAAARFALDRMRMSKLTRHKDAHNFLLAQEALYRVDKWNIATEPLDGLSEVITAQPEGPANNETPQ